jgi:hypothetical protein
MIQEALVGRAADNLISDTQDGRALPRYNRQIQRSPNGQGVHPTLGPTTLLQLLQEGTTGNHLPTTLSPGQIRGHRPLKGRGQEDSPVDGQKGSPLLE